jgi:hypothetical protein
LFEKRPEDWQEIYAATRRQIGLCIGELVKLAQDDLNMTKEDEKHLREIFEAFRSQIARHQERWPVESIDLNDRLCVQSFQEVRKTSVEFKAVMHGLIDRYRTDTDQDT